MKKRTCFYLSENTIERIKSLSVNSNPYVSQSAIIEYLILNTDIEFNQGDNVVIPDIDLIKKHIQDHKNFKEGKIGKEKTKRKKETSK